MMASKLGRLRPCASSRSPLLLTLLLGCSCNRSADHGADAPPAPGLPAEERFDNDRALVVRLGKLAACVYQRGIIDSTCDQLHDLQTYLRQCDAEPSRRKTSLATLITLLQSDTELTRLAATEALARFETSPQLQAALAARVASDPSTQVKAAALTQLCWRDSNAGAKQAIRLLEPAAGSTSAEPLRLAAASCLARAEAAPGTTPQALLAALRGEPAPAVQAQLCAALAGAGAEALPVLIPLLDQPLTAGPCSTAAASIGSEAAYRALLAIVSEFGAAGSPARLHPQHLTALQAFAGQPFVKPRELADAFGQVAAGSGHAWELRCRALLLLEQLGAAERLRPLRDQLQKLPCARD